MALDLLKSNENDSLAYYLHHVKVSGPRLFSRVRNLSFKDEDFIKNIENSGMS